METIVLVEVKDLGKVNVKIFTKWIVWKVNGFCEFFLLGNFEDEILLRGEVCNDPEFLSIKNLNI